MPDLALTALDDLTVLSVRGADTLTFLQGQLSQDVSLLPARGAMLAGLHNPQGRVLALLRLLRLSDDHLLMVLPAELAETVRAQLQRYVLRARVAIEPQGTAWCVYGITGPDAAAAASTRLHMAADGSSMRQLIVAPRGETLPEAEPADRDEWRMDDIAAGIPEIFGVTSGQWVAQMLNLDLLDAVSFNKGCYTGQEVIARAHFRGQVKRRMQRFCTESQAALAPGARILLSGSRGAQVVTSCIGEAGLQEFLAVTNLAGESSTAETASEEHPRIDATLLPLPYTLPRED